jgi:hypothetical protein
MSSNCTGQVILVMADHFANATLSEFIITGRDTYTLMHSIEPSYAFLCALPIWTVMVNVLMYGIHLLTQMVTNTEHKKFSRWVFRKTKRFLWHTFVTIVLLKLAVWETMEAAAAAISRQIVQWIPAISSSTNIFLVMISQTWWGDTWENSSTDILHGVVSIGFTVYIFYRSRVYPGIIIGGWGIVLRTVLFLSSFAVQSLPMLHYQVSTCVPLFPTIWELFSGTYVVNAIPFGLYIYVVLKNAWVLMLWYISPRGWGRVYLWHLIYFNLLCAVNAVPFLGASLQIYCGWGIMVVVFLVYGAFFGWRDKKIKGINFETQLKERISWFHFQTGNIFNSSKK